MNQLERQVLRQQRLLLQHLHLLLLQLHRRHLQPLLRLLQHQVERQVPPRVLLPQRGLA